MKPARPSENILCQLCTYTDVIDESECIGLDLVPNMCLWKLAVGRDIQNEAARPIITAIMN